MHIFLLFIAKYLYIIIILVAFVYWLKTSNEQKVRIMVFGTVMALITLLLVKLGGLTYFDPRPFITNPHLIPLYPHNADNAFPSDHTALSAVVALTVMSTSKKLGVILLTLAIMVGVARVIGNIHSPIDILGSLVFALLAAFAAYYLSPIVLKKPKGNK